jgi:protein-S-isoprenylcysteine O-methyltransferase Ste14
MSDSGSQSGPPPALRHLARLRVPLGFAAAAICMWLADPTPASIAIGLTIAAVGEGLRIWAAGHIEKGREITRSGPYRLMRHPLYVGSAVLALGFIVASRRALVAALVIAYVVVTVGAAVRVEERVLDERFSGEYAAYRAGRAAAVDRRFSAARAIANREYRAVIGLIAGGLLLALRWWLRG